jgi:glycosyltransferase involved in cell wall biosynthesis
MTRIRVHTVDQPDCDITAFVLSCNRLHLLRRTMTSFLATRDRPTKVVIVDDSGLPEVFDAIVAEYGTYADVICFPQNRGLWWAKDFMVSFCSTPYIFYVEEDWLFLNTGYLGKSQAILERHRHIGSIDLSWRTFEDEGYDAYYPELIEGEYYHKKPWQISSNHLHWFCWQGSPNLKRRDDLLLLGRVEKYYNEWNVDRKFYALGFRGVYLKDRYVTHLGDFESLMVNKRPHEYTTPESLYPDALLPTRTFPGFDYYAMDRTAAAMRDGDAYRQHDLCLVTCLLDINRAEHDKRDFLGHYLQGVQKLIALKYPLMIFVDYRYYESILSLTGGKAIHVIPIAPETIRWRPHYEQLRKICESAAWLNQSEWMQTSVIRSPEYVGLTLHKLELMMHCVNHSAFRADRYYWVDAGLCSSFHLDSLEPFDFRKLPAGDKLFMTTFPYQVEAEMHGYARQGFVELVGQIPDFVGRATLFGGSKEAIAAVAEPYNDLLQKSLAAGYIGTEEALFSGLAVQHPQLFNLHAMPSGDIKHYLDTLRG